MFFFIHFNKKKRFKEIIQVTFQTNKSQIIKKKRTEKPSKEIQINFQIKNDSCQVKNENVGFVEQIKKNLKFT